MLAFVLVRHRVPSSRAIVYIYIYIICELGHNNSRIQYKSDQEPAIQAVLETVVRARSAPIVPGARSLPCWEFSV